MNLKLIDIFGEAADGDETAQLLVCALAALTDQLVPELGNMPHGPERFKKTNDNMEEVLKGVKFVAGEMSATSLFQTAFEALLGAKN